MSPILNIPQIMDSFQRNVGIMSHPLSQTFKDSVTEDFGYAYDVHGCLEML